MKKNLLNMLDGLIRVTSLGFTNLSNVHWRCRRIVAIVQNHYRPRGFMTAGTFRARDGQLRMVLPNTDKWFDGLPWMIVHDDGRPIYTVDDDGRVWPSEPYRYPHDLLPNT